MVQQTIKPDEIVIVKDGPIPNLLEQVIVNVQNSCDIYFNEIQLPNNVGLGEALNAGLKECRNDLIARMDADDYSMPERCEKQLRAFEQNPRLTIVSCPVEEFVDELSNVIGYRSLPLTNSDIYSFAKRRDPFNHPSTMYRKSKVLEVGGYGNYRKNQDTDLWIRLLSNNVECLNLSEPLLKFRFDEGTYKKRKSWINTKILIKLRYRAWRSGFNSFVDFFIVAVVQLLVFILPVKLLRNLYRFLLRSKENSYNGDRAGH
uniref:Glycosyltransferase n=2 Tax=Streptococcus suis TaxID=1307 RepID=A0A0F6UX14_STRSU|nr:glycosyltransferase [Streptococcus suis]AKE79973.1 glycosyltransferase [Streptococcus suis]AKE80232.1 glycosyltransferase [Streptococcus suis]AOP03418.1 glycosyltransferase [Streptococcus suis]